MTVKAISSKPVDARLCTCAGCGYRLEFRPSDVRTMQDEDEPSDNGEYVPCPRTGCGKWTRVGTKASAIEDDTW